MTAPPLAESVAARFAGFPQVTAIALAGSEGAGDADELSDIDLYVYAAAGIPVEERRAIARDFASRMEIDNRFWEPGDEWIDRSTGRGIDIMIRSPAWMEDQLARVLARHEAQVGYSTVSGGTSYTPERSTIAKAGTAGCSRAPVSRIPNSFAAPSSPGTSPSCAITFLPTAARSNRPCGEAI